MRVVVTKDQLKSNNACAVYSKSPEWDAKKEELVYTDWTKTVERLLSNRAGMGQLSWLVGKGLVPMTKGELTEALKLRGIHV